MKYYYDLHIHSVLSPCADVLMTPNNLINMANLKGIQIISITDHNSFKQLPVISEIIQSYDMLLVYGAEVEISDGTHILIYFKTLNDALSFDQILEKHLRIQPVDYTRYNEQIITDIEDLPSQVYPYFLGGSLDLDMEELILLLSSYDHLRFLAHVDRRKNSGYQYYHQYYFDGLELTRNVDSTFEEEVKKQCKHILYSSDAQQLVDILERDELNTVQLQKLDIDHFFEVIRNG